MINRRGEMEEPCGTRTETCWTVRREPCKVWQQVRSIREVTDPLYQVGTHTLTAEECEQDSGLHIVEAALYI